MVEKKSGEIWKVVSFILGVFFGIMGLSGIVFVLTQGIQNLNIGNLILLGFSALIFGASIILIKESLK